MMLMPDYLMLFIFLMLYFSFHVTLIRIFPMLYIIFHFVDFARYARFRGHFIMLILMLISRYY